MSTREELNSRVWTTERCRIGAEERLNFCDLVGKLATIWYSVWLVILSVFQDLLRQNYHFIDETSIALSVIVLTFTIAISGLRFGQRADLFKSSYHELQRLRADITNAKDKEIPLLENRYVDVLDGSPNHSSWDYNRLVVKRWWQNRGSADLVRKPSRAEIIFFGLREVLGWFSIILLFGFPLGVIGWMYLVR